MTYFVSGIDTDVGKTIVTGLIARALHSKGVSVITQKFIQTGCEGISEDILKHREIMEVKPYDADKDGTTCPYVMSYPCSPHLAAEIDKVTLDMGVVISATKQLSQSYDIVLLEGAGGLYVPITRDYLSIDYIKDNDLPLILVTSSKLGSINHTLMALELCRLNDIPLVCLAYNHFPLSSEVIKDDTIVVLKDYLKKFFPETLFIEVPLLKGNEYPDLDVDGLIKS